MVHLSNVKTIGAMIFYSLLTYFIGPLITRPFMGDHPDQCIAGYLLGFTRDYEATKKVLHNYNLELVYNF